MSIMYRVAKKGFCHHWRLLFLVALFPGVCLGQSASMGQAMTKMMNSMSQLADDFRESRRQDNQGMPNWQSWQDMAGSGMNPMSMPWSGGWSPWSGMSPLSLYGMMPGNSGKMPIDPSQAWNYAQQMPYARQWFNTPSGSSSSPDTSDQGWPQMQGWNNNPPLSPPRTRQDLLDGNWQSNSGGLLILYQGRYRLYVSRDRHQDGTFRLWQDHIELVPDQAQASRYEYAHQEGRLVLRDASGQLLLFRRFE